MHSAVLSFHIDLIQVQNFHNAMLQEKSVRSGIIHFLKIFLRLTRHRWQNLPCTSGFWVNRNKLEQKCFWSFVTFFCSKRIQITKRDLAYWGNWSIVLYSAYIYWHQNRTRYKCSNVIAYACNQLIKFQKWMVGNSCTLHCRQAIYE